jgi:hypothetical protein
VPGNNGVFFSTVVVSGLIAGTWRRAATAKRVTVTAEWFGARSSIAKPLNRYAQFLGLPAELAG